MAGVVLRVRFWMKPRIAMATRDRAVSVTGAEALTDRHSSTAPNWWCVNLLLHNKAWPL